LKNPTPFKVGEWIFVKKENRSKKHYPIKVVEIDDEQGITYVQFNDFVDVIDTDYFNLVTAEEMKIYKIKNMF
jgi:hypothetical protein